MTPRRLPISLFIGLELLAFGVAAYLLHATRLRPGHPVEARVRPNQTRIYSLRASRGEFLDLSVEQHQVDLTVTLKDARGKVLAVADSPSLGDSGTEVLPVVVEETGRYRVDIDLASDYRNSGTYALRLDVRQPSRTDRLRAKAVQEQAKAEAFEDAGAFEDASSALERALHYAKQAQDLERLPDIRYRQGLFLTHRSGFKSARDALLLAAEEYRTQGNRLGEAHALQAAGFVLFWLNEPSASLDVRQRAYKIYGVIGGRQGKAGQAAAASNMAVTYDSLGSYGRSKVLYEEALEIWPPGYDETGRIHVILNMGGLYLSLADADQARHHFEDALRRIDTLYMNEDLACKKARALGLMGQAYSQERRTSEALPYFQSAFGLSKLCKEVRVFTTIGNHIGGLYLGLPARGMNRYLARLAFRQCYAKAVKAQDYSGAWNAQTGLGGLDILEGNPEEAIELFDKAFEARRARQYRLGVVGALYGRARAERAAGDLEAAQLSIKASLDEMEPLRLGPEADTLSASLFGSRRRNYDLSVSLWMERHRREPEAGFAMRAFEDNEKARARTLMDWLASDRFAGGKLAMEARERELSQRLRSLQQKKAQLQSLPQGLRTAEVLEQERDLDGEIKALTLTIAAARTQGRTLDLKSSAPLSLPDIRENVLDEGTLLLSYWFGGDGEGSYLWAVDRSSIVAHSFTREDVAEIEDLAAKVSRNFVERKGSSEALQDLSALSRLILAPVAHLLKDRRLLVVADGELQALPFPALQDPRFRIGANGWDGYEPLLERHTVIMLPSASMLGVLRRELAGRPPAAKTVAILADPVFQLDDERLFRTNGEDAERTALLDSGFEDLGRLIHTREEAQAIEELVSPGERFTARDFEANLDTVRSGKLAQYRIVHFATHGLSHSLPELAGLALSRVDRNGSERDGFLQAFEISRMRLPADLVVLSACGTGLGTKIPGEGVFNLSRAFFYAGARRVVVTHWNVDDRATSVLMRLFYGAMLNEDLPPSEALRKAQRQMRHLPDWDHPYFWGGFVLQGEW